MTVPALSALAALIVGAFARDLLGDLVKPRADRFAAWLGRRKRGSSEELRLLRRIEKQTAEIVRRLPKQ